jgi:RimJ/RimL family protein N-acetyltransferase
MYHVVPSVRVASTPGICCACGLHRAELGVEECNPRARALYERLGYVASGSAPESWDEDAPDGSVARYETMCTLMRKELR